MDVAEPKKVRWIPSLGEAATGTVESWVVVAGEVHAVICVEAHSYKQRGDFEVVEIDRIREIS